MLTHGRRFDSIVIVPEEYLRQLSVVVEPLLGHLGDEQRRLVDLLPGHDEAGVGDANVQPLTQDQLLVAKLGIAQELLSEITKSALNFAQHSFTAITKPHTPYKTAYDDEYGIRCSFSMTLLFSKEK